MTSNSKTILIFKLGSTFSELSIKIGDFEHWIQDSISYTNYPITILDAKRFPPLPGPSSLAGIILTGSSAMVTDKEEWSKRLKPWLIHCAHKNTPILGICYGHQLLAETFGGKVGNRSSGAEIGTVTITKNKNSEKDKLFKNLPINFTAHTIHWQSISQLPSDAILLASSNLDMYHAYRIGNTVWGVQFHPEFSETAMSFLISEYQSELIKEGKDTQTLLQSITPTKDAENILKNFGELCTSNLT